MPWRTSQSPRTLTLPYGYTPRSYQARALAAYDRGVRRLITVWPRRHGKDKSFLNLVAREGMRRVGNYVHLFPFVKDGRDIVWNGIDREGKRYLDHFPAALIWGQDDSNMILTLRHPQDLSKPGSTYAVMGTNRNLNAVVGRNPVGVGFSEFSLQNPRAWDLTRPVLRENGGWAWFLYTPRGKNHGHSLYSSNLRNPDWYVEHLTIDQTCRDAAGEDGSPVVSRADMQRDIAEGMPLALAEQEYLCSWSSPMPGAYYGEELRLAEQEGRIGRVPWDPSLPVYTAWDLGLNHVTAIWFFQQVGGQVRFIDYEEAADINLEKWCARVLAKPYVYDQAKVAPPLTRDSYVVHYGPHDLDVSEYGSGKTRRSIALAAGINFTVLPRGTLDDGIAAARRLLAVSVFDEVKCERGLDALRSYRRTWDERTMSYGSHPVEEWCCDGADAYRYSALGILPPPGPVNPQAPPGSFEYHRKRLARERRRR